MYHKFDISKYPSTNITLEQFEEHLQEFSHSKYNIKSLDFIMDTIINAILKKDYHSNHPKKSSFKSESARSHVGEHPFN